MDLYFPRKQRRILRYIKRHPQATLGTIEKKFGEDANSWWFSTLAKEGYVQAMRANGEPVDYATAAVIRHDDKFWLTYKSIELLETTFSDRAFNTIPIIVSVASLVVSILK